MSSIRPFFDSQAKPNRVCGTSVTALYRAAWVLPIVARPIRDGWVLLDGDRIAGVGPAGEEPKADTIVELGAVAVMPGLVNAHTHLELSYLHERIPPAPGFGHWVRAVMTARSQYPNAADTAIVEPARRAIADARRAGTCLFGDISNTLVTVPLLREAGMPAQVFHELTGFTEQDPEGRVRDARARVDALGDPAGDIRLSVAPHAPYSVSAALFQAIRADLDAHPEAVSSVHLGETPDEVQLLRDGSGEIRGVLEGLGRWPEGWKAPGERPVEYLDRLGVLDERMLVVHGVQFGREDLARLRELGTTLVSCPRSNVYVGVGSPPLEQFYESGVKVAFGTDSLASVADLEIFRELAEARHIAPGVPAARLLESATLCGAEALGFASDFGSIEPGKRAALIAVALPAGANDVEEYLVGGMEPEAIRWLPGAHAERRKDEG